MYFEDPSKSTKSTERSTRSKKKAENENKILQPSQGGRIKLTKSKELVAGTYDEEDDDVIEIPDSPPAVFSQPKSSIFNRRPKPNSQLIEVSSSMAGSSQDSDIVLMGPSRGSRNRAGSSQSTALKAREDNKKVIQKDPAPKSVKQSPAVSAKKSPAKNTRKSKSPVRNTRKSKSPVRNTRSSRSPARNASKSPSRVAKKSPARKTRKSKSPIRIDSESPPSVARKSPEKKSAPKINLQLSSMSKRSIESDSDDDFSFFDQSMAKKSRKDDQSTQMTQQSKSQLPSTSQNSTISKQLKTAHSSSLKRPSDHTQDDLFSFEAKKVRKVEPKLRNKPKVPVAAPTTAVNVKPVISVQSSSSDTPMDLEPGQECESTGWLSKDSLVGIKKEEEPDSENEESASSAIHDSSTVSVFRVVPCESNINESSEVRGKTFRKKLNYKPQTTIIKTRVLDIEDANLLYPMALE